MVCDGVRWCSDSWIHILWTCDSIHFFLRGHLYGVLLTCESGICRLPFWVALVTNSLLIPSMWTFFAPLILQARRGGEGCYRLDLMHPGNAGISRCHCDVDWFWPWTWGTGKFQQLFREHLNTGNSVSLFYLVHCGIIRSLVLYNIKGNLICHPGRFTDRWQYVCFLCVFIRALSFCSRAPGILASKWDFHYWGFFHRIFKYFDFLTV